MAYQQGYRPPTRQQQTTSRRPASQTQKRNAPRNGRTRKRRRHPIKMFLTLAVLAVIATLGVMIYIMYDAVASVERDGTFYPGVYIDGYSLHGMQPQAAYDHLLAQAQAELQDWSIVLQYGDVTWTIDTGTLGLLDALEESVRDQINQAFYIGRQGDTFIERYQTIRQLKEQPYEAYTAGAEKDTSKIDVIVADIQNALYKPATDAGWKFDPERKTNPIVVTEEVTGQQVNGEALRAKIIEMINNMDAGYITIEPEPLVPAITAAALEGQIVLIGQGETKISSRSTPERNLNVERGCQAFHGKEVKAGEQVSFNSWVGPRTKDNGFHDAEEIVSGEYKMGTGGGICQVSSTLYNAVIGANLKVVERRNHGIPVNYLEMGADATVSDGRIDFVFQNNTGSSVYMIARLDYSKNTCLVQIYGRPDPDGQSYSLRHELVETIPVPEPTRVPDKDEEYVLYIGEEMQVTDGQEGYIVDTYLVTKAANGNVIRDELIYTDTYKAQPPQVYYGLNRKND